MKKKSSPKSSTLKNDLLNGLGELAIWAVILILAFGFSLLHPINTGAFEFYILIAFFVLAFAVGIWLFLRLLLRELKKSKLSEAVACDEGVGLVYPPHSMRLHPLPFAAIQRGHKTLELRLYDPKRQRIKIGDMILFTQTETGEQLRAEVVDLRPYPSFEAIYASEDPIAMGYNQGENADPADMHQYYTEDMIEQYGTLAIEIRKIEA